MAGARRRITQPAGGRDQVPGIPAGSSTHVLELGGYTRTFHLYRPPALLVPAPLVVMLHGGFGNGLQAERSYGWDAVADAGQFVVAYPDGFRRAWNTGGGCCGQPAARGIDDVGFVTEVVKTIGRRIQIDPTRIYATGISNGGMMTYALACNTAIFAAIGPVAATHLGDCRSPRPLSIVHVHGTADTRIPYAGGQGNGPARIDGPAVRTVIERWRQIDGCGPEAVTQHGAVTTSVATSPQGFGVDLVTIFGAGHQWPGSVGRPVLQKMLGLDPPSRAFRATEHIWHFFAHHPAPRCPG
jgi:polyhydroxybutyrate depolymerase